MSWERALAEASAIAKRLVSAYSFPFWEFITKLESWLLERVERNDCLE